MPSTLQNLALGAALLGGSALARDGASTSCPLTANSPLSCHNTTAVANTCCFNAPGGQLLQTQFWDLGTGPSDSFTVHGLWPDNCDGTYQANCDASRAYTNISAIIGQANPDLLKFMNTYWKNADGTDESFWEHEWSKHGTCISTLDPKCYSNYQPTEEVPDFFNRTVSLFQTLNSYQFLEKAGITPSTSKNYTSAAVLAALKAGHGATPSIQCTNGVLDEVWYFYNTKGSVQTGDFVPSEPDGSKSNCPASLSWPPKTGGSGPSSSSSTSVTTSPTPKPKPHHQAHEPRWV